MSALNCIMKLLRSEFPAGRRTPRNAHWVVSHYGGSFNDFLAHSARNIWLLAVESGMTGRTESGIVGAPEWFFMGTLPIKTLAEPRAAWRKCLRTIYQSLSPFIEHLCSNKMRIMTKLCQFLRLWLNIDYLISNCCNVDAAVNEISFLFLVFKFRTI